MSSEAFNVEAKIEVNGIRDALAGILDLTEQAKTLAGVLDRIGSGLDLSKVSKELAAAQKRINKGVDALPDPKEIEAGAKQSIDAIKSAHEKALDVQEKSSKKALDLKEKEFKKLERAEKAEHSKTLKRAERAEKELSKIKEKSDNKTSAKEAARAKKAQKFNKEWSKENKSFRTEERKAAKEANKLQAEKRAADIKSGKDYVDSFSSKRAAREKVSNLDPNRYTAASEKKKLAKFASRREDREKNSARQGNLRSRLQAATKPYFKNDEERMQSTLDSLFDSGAKASKRKPKTSEDVMQSTLDEMLNSANKPKPQKKSAPTSPTKWEYSTFDSEFGRSSKTPTKKHLSDNESEIVGKAASKASEDADKKARNDRAKRFYTGPDGDKAAIHAAERFAADDIDAITSIADKASKRHNAKESSEYNDELARATKLVDGINKAKSKNDFSDLTQADFDLAGKVARDASEAANKKQVDAIEKIASDASAGKLGIRDAALKSDQPLKKSLRHLDKSSSNLNEIYKRLIPLKKYTPASKDEVDSHLRVASKGLFLDKKKALSQKRRDDIREAVDSQRNSYSQADQLKYDLETKFGKDTEGSFKQTKHKGSESDAKYERAYKRELRRQGDAALNRRVREELKANGIDLNPKHTPEEALKMSRRREIMEAGEEYRNSLPAHQRVRYDQETERTSKEPRVETPQQKATREYREKRDADRKFREGLPSYAKPYPKDYGYEIGPNPEEPDARRARIEKERAAFKNKKFEKDRAELRKVSRREEIDLAENRYKRSLSPSDRLKYEVETYKTKKEMRAHRGPDGPGLGGGPHKPSKIGEGFTVAKGAAASLLGNLGADAIREAFQAFMTGLRQATAYMLEFQQSVQDMNSLFGMSDSKLKEYTKGLTSMYERTGVGTDAIEAAEAGRDLGAIGISDPDEAMRITEQASRMAVAGNSKLPTTTQVLGGAMIGWKAPMEEAQKYVDAFVVSADLGRVTMDDYSTSLGRAAPMAVQAGVGIQEFTTLVGVGTQGLLRGESAILGVGEALEKFSGSGRSKEATEYLKRYNYELNNTVVRAKGPIKVIKELSALMKKAGDDHSKAWTAIAGSRSGSRLIQALLDPDGGTTRLEEGMAKTMAGEGVATEERIKIVMEGALRQFELFKAQIKEAVAEMGEILGPAVAGLLKRLNGDLKPEMDSIMFSVKLLATEFLKLFSTGGDSSTLQATLQNIAQSINDATKFMLAMSGITKILFNAVKFLTNTVLWAANNVMSWLGVVYDFLDGYANGDSFIDSMAKAEAARKSLADDAKKNFDSMADSYFAIFEEAPAEFAKSMGAVGNTIITEQERVMNSAIDNAKKMSAEMVSEADILPGDVDLGSAKKRLGIKEQAGGADKEERENPYVGLSNIDKAFLGEIYRLFDEDREILKKLDPEGLTGKAQFNRGSMYGYLDSDVANSAAGGADLNSIQIQLLKEAIFGSHKTNTKATGTVESSSAPRRNMPPAEKQPERRDITANMATIKHLEDTDQINSKEAILRWESLLRYTKLINSETNDQNGTLEEQRRIEKEIFTIKKEQGALAKADAKEKDKVAKVLKKERDDARVKHVTNVQGKRAGAIAKLDLDVKRKKAAGVPQDEIDAWAKSERVAITNKYNKQETDKKTKESDKKADESIKTLKFEAELAGAENDPLKEQLLLLEAEKLNFEKTEKDKTKIARLYEAKRLQIQKDFAKDAESVRQDVLSQIAQNEIEVLRAKGETEKADKKEREISNAEQYLAIKNQVDEWKKAGVSKVDIEKFLSSEILRITQDTKTKKDNIEKGLDPSVNSISGSAADPRRAADDSKNEDGGFKLGGFSLGGFSSDEDREARKEAKDNKAKAKTDTAHIAKLSALKGTAGDTTVATGDATEAAGATAGAAVATATKPKSTTPEWVAPGAASTLSKPNITDWGWGVPAPKKDGSNKAGVAKPSSTKKGELSGSFNVKPIEFSLDSSKAKLNEGNTGNDDIMKNELNVNVTVNGNSKEKVTFNSSGVTKEVNENQGRFK